MQTQRQPEPSSAPKAASGNPLRVLEAQGQAVWLDYIRRNLLTCGELKRLVEEDGLSGVTSNPTIFEKAIAGSSDYDAALREALSREAEQSSAALFEGLAIDDMRAAADILRPVYDRTQGADGFVSLEVSPTLAHDTPGTLNEARRLWGKVDRPNLMIKVPATPEGIPAIEALIADGINVNITLMFSLAHYEKVAQAYLRGVARCARPERVASVASFFVSRVDSVVDPLLEANGSAGTLALRGKAAIANSRAVYHRFREIFQGDAFAPLRAKGARVQRVLWASTSTKNPAYRDVMYIEELIGPDTVNTVPPATIEAFRNHGQVRGNTIAEGIPAALAELAALKTFGVSLDSVTEKLQTDGVSSFSASFETLLAAIDSKRRAILRGQLDSGSQTLPGIEGAVKQRLASWQTAEFSRRLWAKDFTLWAPKLVPEITDRLGWLHLPETMHEQVDALVAFREEIKRDGFTHAVLLGMGGSSLAPEVFQKTFGSAPGCPELRVLDSTHPAAVKDVESKVDLAHTLFFLSSKSGTTTEMLSFFYYFWQRVSGLSKTPGRQFAAITDPGTPLEKLAKERGFRKTFSATPDVGGRYSALTHFGLVPAAVIGVDLHRLLDRAWTMEEACASCVPAADDPGLVLGAILGEAALAGRDKVTFFASPSLRSFPTWLEQLIAESTGKDGKGIVPVANEASGKPESYGRDRLFVHLQLASEGAGSEEQLGALEAAGHPVVRIHLRELADIGQEFFRWEIAVAAAGAVIGIQPFNQPDVQLAKDLARQAMKSPAAAGSGKAASKAVDAGDEKGLRTAVESWLGGARPGDYVGIDAYLAPLANTAEALARLRATLGSRTRLATMFGYGPRFLHSTGQLHKGGPNTGLFLQLLDEPAEDVGVPETDYTFGKLIQAQALGDFTALEQRGRRILRVQLGRDARGGLENLLRVLNG
jgi:transaldolase/glucose-6-phosphate isomerase